MKHQSGEAADQSPGSDAPSNSRAVQTAPKATIAICCFIACTIAFKPAVTKSAEPAAATSGAVSAADTKRVALLVEELGNAKFAARNLAMGQLGEFGPRILPLLVKALKHPDPEVRHRLSVLMQILREDDFKSRLEAFASGKEQPNAPEMPFWTPYSKLVGDSPQSRSLFVAMLRAEGDLLQQIHVRPSSAAELTGSRALQLQQSINTQTQQIPFASIATMLLLGVKSDQPLTQQAEAAIFGLCYQSSLRQALASDQHGAPTRKLLGAWIQRGKDWSAYQAISLSLTHGLENGLVPALRVLKEGPAHVHIRQYAIIAIARFGDKSHAPQLKKLLTDKTVCGQLRGPDSKIIACQIRDVALAAQLHLRGIDPKEFGFPRYQTHATTVFVATTAGFENDEQREAIQAKWAALEAKSRSGKP